MTEIKIFVKNWSSTYGLPQIIKKFNIYDKLIKWYPEGDFKKRSVMKIPIINKKLKEKIEKLNDVILKNEEGERVKVIKKSEKYEDYMKARLYINYDIKKRKHKNEILTKIYLNEKLQNGKIRLEDLNRMLYNSKETKLIIFPFRIWNMEKSCGIIWSIKSIEIMKDLKKISLKKIEKTLF